MNTPLISIVYFLIASLLGALGQYLYKSGADSVSGGAMAYLTNVRLLVGVICYIAVMVLFVAAFKKGGQMSVLYPIYATTFVWAAIISMVVYGTEIKLINVGGMVLLIGGIYLMSR